MAANRAELLRLLEKMGVPIGSAFLEAVAKITSRAQIMRLTLAIEAGNIEAAFQAAGMRVGSWGTLTESIRNAYITGGAFVMARDVPKRFGAEFNISNPRAEQWLRQHSSQLITLINADQRDSVQILMRAGLQAGRNPKSIGLDIVGRIGANGRRSGGVLGLNGPQTQYLADFRQALSGPLPVGVHRIGPDGNPVKKFWIGNDGELQSVYSRRDKRFDGTVRKAIANETPLDTATVNRLTGRYSDRLLKLRGDTIGRTEALSALNESSDEALRQIVQEGLAPPDAVTRIWRHSFSQNERPGHLQMSGQERGINEPFLNPLTGVSLQHPGEGPASETINCRCMIEHKIDFIKAEMAA